MSTEQFGRLIAVNVFNRQETTGSDGAQALMNVDPTGTQFRSTLTSGDSGFRIKFHVQKATGPVPNANPCIISIYNLGPLSRALCSKFNNLVILQAGYGNNLQNLFQGNILTAKTQKFGPDYVTEMQVVDGLFAFQNSMVNLSFGKGTAQSSIIQSICATMQQAGITVGTIQGVPGTNVNQGIVLSGKSTDKLKQICDKNNLSFSIQDNQIQILPYGAAKSPQIISLSENTGLIGIPEIRDLTAVTSATAVEQNSSASTKARAPRIGFKCLLNPKIGCYQQVQIVSKFVNGLYTTTLVSHDGDTYTQEFYTNAEAS